MSTLISPIFEKPGTQVVCIYPSSRNRWDGIADYSRRLTNELRNQGAEISIERPHGAYDAILSLLRRRKGDRVVLLLQYNPFAWGHWGFSPWLIVSVALLRVLRSNIEVAVVIHEPYIARTNLRAQLMGSWQRLQLRCLLRFAHLRVASTESFAHELNVHWPRRTVLPLPVGSNLSDERSARARERVQRGIDDHLVIASISAGHDSYLRNFVSDAVTAIVAGASRPVALLLLGANNPSPTGLDGLAYIDSPGYLTDRSLARALAAADIFLAPYRDGASTRRTSLMAALQHALAIVTTIEPHSDSVLRDTDAMIVVNGSDPAAFASAAAQLALDDSEMIRLGSAARRLYDQSFSWQVIADKLVTLLG